MWLAVLGAVVAAAFMYIRHGQAPRVPSITTALVTRGSVIEVVDATGTLGAVTTVQVGSQVSGTIKALHADFNANVRRGQVIAEIDPSVFETQVEQARASVMRLETEVHRADVLFADAQQKLARARKLSAEQLIPATDLETAEMNVDLAAAEVDSAQAQVVQARASLQQAEVNLKHTIITAPIDGIVISRNVDVGQTVAASMQAPTLFVIARDLRAMQVEASIAESDIGRIRNGQLVSFTVDAYPADVFKGVVSQVRLQPVVEQNVVSYVTVIDVVNRDLRLKPGMTANVAVEIARTTNMLRVPNAALRVRPSVDVLKMLEATPDAGAGESMRTHRGTESPYDDEGTPDQRPGVVWVYRDGRLVRVPVWTGITDGTYTAIAGAPLEGAAVVTSIAGATTTPATTSPLLPPGRGRGAAGRGAAGGPSRGS